MANFYKGEVVQFVEGDKWCGALGFISEVKKCGDDIRYMVGVNVPTNDGKGGIAYRYSMESEKEFESMNVIAYGLIRPYVIPPLLPEGVLE